MRTSGFKAGSPIRPSHPGRHRAAMRGLLQPSRQSAILIALACLAMLVLQAWIEWGARATQVRETEVSMANLASALMDQADDTIDIADASLIGLVERIETDGTSARALANLNRKLGAQTAAIPRYRAMTILDKDGNWLAGSLPESQGNYADRAYFRHHRDDPGRAAFRGPPVQSRVTGDWILTLSRRFNAPDGAFGGIAFAVIDLSYFVDRFATYDLGPGSSILLSATDGTLLARYPVIGGTVGKNFSNATVFAKLGEKSAGSFATTAVVDREQRFVGYRQSDRYQLVASAAMSQGYALAAWRADAAVHMAIILVLTIGVGLLGMHLLRQVRRSQRAERALRKSEERHRLLLSSDVFEAAYMLDPAGNIETWNLGAQRLKGYERDEVIGRNFTMFFTAEDRASGEPERLLATARESGWAEMDGWRVRKDGSRFLAHVVINAIRQPDGTLRGFAKIAHDVTSDRIEEEQRAIIIEAAPNGMMIVDEAGLITLANSKAGDIFGYASGVLTGQPVEILVPEALRDCHAAMRSPFACGEADMAMAPQRQVTGRKRDGSPVSIEIMLSPVKTPRGRIVVASLFDVTDRIRLEAERAEAERLERQAIEASNESLARLSRHLAKARDRADAANHAKSRFLAGMTHELRTPLNGILGYAQMLRMNGGLNPAQARQVDAMMAAGKHLLQMITRVLDVSEIESDHLELCATAFDVRAVAATCLDLIRPAAAAKQLALGIAVAPGTPRELVADEMRVRQVLLNLLGNAVKFTGQGRIELTVRSSADGSAIRIEVADTGPGVPADQRARLFQAFERLDTEATRASEGAGLGLSLSSRLAALMKGRLGYDDNAGGGSVFWLELPLDTQAAAAAEEAADTSPDASPARPLRVLVVDDVLMNRDIASSFLRAAGHEVTCAEGGAEAVAAVASTDFDIVLMDVRMPEMDGLEATRRIRALQDARGRVPVLALTAQAFTDQLSACRDAGMDGHLVKPFELDGLLAAVARAAAVGPRPQGPAAVPVTPPDLPVLDLLAFERTAAHLSPETVAAYLLTIAEQGESLVRGLRAPGGLAGAGDALAEAAHKLAGSAGIFGFQRLSAAGKAFERAIQSGAADAPVLAARLGAAAEDTCLEINSRALCPGRA